MRDCFLDQQEINVQVYMTPAGSCRYWSRKTSPVSSTPAKEGSCKRLTRWCLEVTIPTSSVSQPPALVCCFSSSREQLFGRLSTNANVYEVRIDDLVRKGDHLVNAQMRTWIRDRRRESTSRDRLAAITTSPLNFASLPRSI